MQQQSEASALRFQLLSNLPDFGFSNLVSSWTFLNFLQYFGDSEMREQTGYLLSPSFFEIITDRDPGFIDSYIYLANSISMYAGQPRESIRLMEQGLSELSPETVPRSYLVWRHKATDELLFVRDTQAAQISYATAADWAERSADPDAANIAAASNQTAVFLANEPNSKPAQISAWSQVLLRATDDTIREAAISNIEALGGRVLLAENGQVTVRYRSEE
ncbi:MAG: hypothetical protein AAF821_08640 [Cyanobacteria bacterium P01_D01_bin.156]